MASIRPIPPNSPTDLRVTEASRWSPSTRPPPAIACRPPSQYDAGVLQAIDRGMPLDYHDVRPGFPSANAGISYMFPLLTDVPGTPRPSLPGTQRRWSRPPAPEPCTGRMCYMPEPSHHQPSQEHPHAFAIGIHDVLTGPPHEGELGEGLLLGRTGATSRRSCIRPRRRSTG